MQAVIVAGIVIAGVGVLLLALTTKWVKSWGNQYATTNRPLSVLGWLLLAAGLAVVILAAMANGQLG